MKIQVALSRGDLVRFSLFDALVHQRGWVRPALFAAILSAAAALCFVMRERRGAVLLGAVLLAVALGLPAAWVLSFFLSAREQARAQDLGAGKYVYTLELGEGELAVDNGRERASWPWEQVFRAYRRPGAVYLYAVPRRAFLIPFRCVDGDGEALWALVERRLPAGKRRA